MANKANQATDSGLKATPAESTEALAFLKEAGLLEGAVSDVPADGVEAATPAPPVDEVEPVEVAASDEDADGDDTAEDQAKDDETGEKASKPSRAKKWRAKALENEKSAKAANARAAQLEAEKIQLLKHAADWQAYAQFRDQELQQTLAQTKQMFGHEPNPVEVENARLRYQLQQHQRQMQLSQAQAQDVATQQQQAELAEHTANFTKEANALATKYPGVDPSAILIAYAGRREVEEARLARGLKVERPVTLEDVARLEASFLKISKDKEKHAATREQHQVNKTAPLVRRTPRGKTMKPSYENGVGEAKDYLKSLGLAD